MPITIQADKTWVWIAAIALVAAIVERRLQKSSSTETQNARSVNVVHEAEHGGKVVNGVIGLIGESIYLSWYLD